MKGGLALSRGMCNAQNSRPCALVNTSSRPPPTLCRQDTRLLGVSDMILLRYVNVAPALCRRCQRARKSGCGVSARSGELRTSTLPVHPALFAAWAAPLAQCPRRPNVSGSAPCCLGHSVAHCEPPAAHPRKREYRCAGSRCYHGCE